MENKDEDYAIYGNVDVISGKVSFIGTRKEAEEELARNEIIQCLRENFEPIREALKFYIDLKEEYYTIAALWILGTYLHNQFESYPYLYFNAMRGSGKTKTLRLIIYLSKDGILMTSPTEAVLFRSNGTLALDEIERIGNKKELMAVREMLNASYKKGMKVLRMKKKKVLGQEEQVVEEFEPYRPIVLANISGMDEVLGDRCITLVLEKSDDPLKTRLSENFESNNPINLAKNSLNEQFSVVSVGVGMLKNIYKCWDIYLINRYKTTLTTQQTYTTQDTQTTPTNIKLDSFFNKVHDTGIIGRNLELFLPLFFIAYLIDDKILTELLNIAKEMTASKKHEEEIESTDVMVYDFISREEDKAIYHSVKELTERFRTFSDYGFAEWLNPFWFGKALKRLNLITEKRRLGYGVEIMLNVKKAKEKIKMFKPKEEKEDAGTM